MIVRAEGTEQWRRLVPQSTVVVLQAWNTWVHYATFHLPPEFNGYYGYNALQQIAYVFRSPEQRFSGRKENGQEETGFRSPCIPRDHRRGQEICILPAETRNLCPADAADAVFYIQTGKAKLTVVSKTGKEATIAILTDGDFFGEGLLVGQPLRMCSATAMTDCVTLRIDKKAMMEALHQEHEFSDLFVAYLLARNIRYEEDLVDQLFNSSERRLARVLLLLAHFGKEGIPQTVVPKISQEMLEEMIGTTRSRASFFMNRFRELGFTTTAACKSTARCSMLSCTTNCFRCNSPRNKMAMARVRLGDGLAKKRSRPS